jgi:hydrogenase nickel incorporation protein HypA/HybF
MHELAIMQSALDMAEEKALAAGASQIHRLRLRIGELSGVVPEALRFAYEALRPGTMAAEAELEIDEIPALCWCPACNADFHVAALNFECPKCHQRSGDLRKGNEMDLTSMEIS